MKKLIVLAVGLGCISSAHAGRGSDAGLVAALTFGSMANNLSNLAAANAIAKSNQGGNLDYALQKIDQVKDAASQDIIELKNQMNQLNEQYQNRFKKIRNFLKKMNARVKALEVKAGIKSNPLEGDEDE